MIFLILQTVTLQCSANQNTTSRGQSSLIFLIFSLNWFEFVCPEFFLFSFSENLSVSFNWLLDLAASNFLSQLSSLLSHVISWKICSNQNFIQKDFLPKKTCIETLFNLPVIVEGPHHRFSPIIWIVTVRCHRRHHPTRAKSHKINFHQSKINFSVKSIFTNLLSTSLSRSPF